MVWIGVMITRVLCETAGFYDVFIYLVKESYKQVQVEWACNNQIQRCRNMIVCARVCV